MDVLILNTVPQQRDKGVVADFLQRKWKKLLSPGCATCSGQFHFLSLPSVREGLTTYRMIPIANEMHISSNKEIIFLY